MNSLKDKNIENCKLFSNIEVNRLYETFEQIHFQIKSFEKETFIAARNTEYKNLMIVIKGIVKTEMTDFKGATVKMADIKEYESLAPAFLFGNSNLLPVDIIAKTDVQVLLMPKEEVLKFFNLCPQFLINFLNTISARTQHVIKKIRFLSFRTLKGKFAFYLLKLAQQQNSFSVKLKNTQLELAEIFGATRPSVARAVKQLANEGCITVKGKYIEIKDKEKISAYLKYEDHIHSV
ncbi:MAG: Crp/Fnr family transcriptional regulator [Bacteroidales bacterium]|nr:Crp/Fnr family transcriptional regulator [Bacteroidales bacterium]